MPHWSRANGWGMWAMSEALLYLPENHPHYRKILKHFRKHAKSLIRYQNKRGFWPNVVDYPESRDEVSGTAIFVMAMARGVREKWLDRKIYQPVVEKAWNAIKTQIDRNGTVCNICYGTMCTDDVNYYINRPFMRMIRMVFLLFFLPQWRFINWKKTLVSTRKHRGSLKYLRFNLL